MIEPRNTGLLEMEERFHSLVSRCAPSADPHLLFKVVVEKYSEPHRHYHTLEHIKHCLSQLDQVSQLAEDPDSLELAIWFHDLIYDPGADDNEQRSAEMFVSLLGNHMSPERVSAVHNLIMATVHPSEPNDHDARLMVDIDLSSFALPWDEFIRDTNAIRAEFSHVPQQQFVTGKLKFLESLLARSKFYLTKYFQEHLESRARSNITRHLDDIEEDPLTETLPSRKQQV